VSVDLYHIDCMEFLREQADKSFDLAIVDAPYGIGESGATNHSRGKLAVAKDYKPFAGGDLCAPDAEYFTELQRVSVNQIIWGANHFLDNISFAKSSPCWIVWDKLNGETDFADCELAWTSFKTAVRKFSFQWQGMIQGYGGNKSKNEDRIHPTQKPVALYKWLLAKYAKQDQRILDTHLGSGSSAIAAHYFGCDFVGCELDEDYYTAAVNRFNQETKQQAMAI
jgi:site-specific DNA-methyltransferase (adenine-specific)